MSPSINNSCSSSKSPRSLRSNYPAITSTIPGWLWVPLILAILAIEGWADSPIQLSDVTRLTGIGFVHTDGSSGRHYIVETVASGLATFDYNNDGKIDILFLNGAPLPGFTKTNPPPSNALYRNEGGWKFTDVTQASGLTDSAYHLGVCIGDYDNDGFPDIYLNNFGPNILYHNNGDGTFTDVTTRAGVGVGNHVGAGASFLDYDGDGLLDLFVANYVGFTFETHQISHMNGLPEYVGPLAYPPTSNLLFHNNGDGTFTDVSVTSGISAFKGSGMGVICADFDNDGDTDIILGNDLRANFVFQNDGHGKFTEVAIPLGIAYDSFGNVQGSMGVECADWDNDGWLDVYITTYQRQLCSLYQNQKGAFFDEVSRKTGAGAGSYPLVKWGVGFVDFDNDGHRDLFVACGHLIDDVEKFDNTTSYQSRNLLLRNTGDGKFIDITASAGSGLTPKLSSRGTAFDDLDNDGWVDGVVLNSRREPTILKNQSPRTNHWLQVQLQGTKSNRDGIGARVSVTSGALSQIDEVHSGRSYQSDFGKRLQFGLGTHKTVDQIQVKWIGGGIDIVTNVPVDSWVKIVEGKGVVPR
jgi:hypothetical protein